MPLVDRWRTLPQYGDTTARVIYSIDGDEVLVRVFRVSHRAEVHG